MNIITQGIIIIFIIVILFIILFMTSKKKSKIEQKFDNYMSRFNCNSKQKKLKSC